MWLGKSQIKVEEMKAEVIKETRYVCLQNSIIANIIIFPSCSEALQAMREEIDGKLVGLERVVIDTR